jgi:hypothetical protein
MGRYVEKGEYRRMRTRAQKAETALREAKIEIEALERFRDLRTRHNQEMERRTTQNIALQEEVGKLKEQLFFKPQAAAQVLSEENVKLREEVAELRKALWDFYDVAGAVGPVQAGSAVWSHVARVLDTRRPEDPKPGEAGYDKT